MYGGLSGGTSTTGGPCATTCSTRSGWVVSNGRAAIAPELAPNTRADPSRRQPFQQAERIVRVLGHPLLGLGVVEGAAGHAARVIGCDGVFNRESVGDAVEGGRAARSSWYQ